MLRRLLVLPLLTACAGAPTQGRGTTTSDTPSSAAPREIVWADEFEGPAGAPAEPARWVADTGGGGWGNQERQYYTPRENAALDGQGHLVITARAEPAESMRTCWYGRCRYTSARLKTKGRFEQTFGRFEARIRVPRGQGIWPAFWMLGADIDRVGWPTCGEIDVMEHIGREPATAHGTMHGPGYSGANGIGNAVAFERPVADDFHVFAVEWTVNDLRWFVDGREYFRTTSASLPPSARWVFDHPFFLLLNLAVGGAWPGDPDATSTYPQEMVVDYVRVYR